MSSQERFYLLLVRHLSQIQVEVWTETGAMIVAQIRELLEIFANRPG